MSHILIGERVINRVGEVGTILSFDGSVICVDFQVRVAKLMPNAFEKGFLRYENPRLQAPINSLIAQARAEEQEQAEQKRKAEDKAKRDREAVQAMMSRTHFRVAVTAASIRLDPSPLDLKSVRRGDEALIREIFTACDGDAEDLYQRFQPKMAYPSTTSHARTRYGVGFLTQYADTYVFRVFSRTDVYKKSSLTDVTILDSDTAEVYRVMCVNGKVYCFANHVTYAGGHFNHSAKHDRWHVAELHSAMVLDEVIRLCECGYLTDYVEANRVCCKAYASLLFAALRNNKAEIVFKQRLFVMDKTTEELECYLESYSSKQVDFAARHRVLNTLPFIKENGLYDLDVLLDLEQMFRPIRNGWNVYTQLQTILSDLGLECPDFHRALIDFLRRVERFDVILYSDYIRQLSLRHNVTLRDVFDKHYLDRHYEMTMEDRVYVSERDRQAYATAAQELSWIDREEGGYFICVPKTIADLRDEGSQQHNCVFTLRYDRWVVNRRSIIVFLRREKDVSFVTIEFDYDTFEVEQAFGKFNAQIDPALYQYVVQLGQRLHQEVHAH